jgi:hypothetical protein
MPTDLNKVVLNFSQKELDEIEEKPEFDVVLRTRDSNLREIANTESLIQAFNEQPECKGFYKIKTENHWGYGWHVKLIVTVKNGEDFSPAFKLLYALTCVTSDYPVLDDALYSKKQYAATIQHIISGLRFIEIEGTGESEELADKIYAWLFKNDQKALEDPDDCGAYPTDDQLRNALRGLNVKTT